MARDEDMADATATSDSATWFAGYSARFAKTAEDTARASVTMADRWARRLTAACANCSASSAQNVAVW